MKSDGQHEAVEGGWLRPVVEAAVGLAISVAVFRGFAIEGFMISTGSMAPTMYGYHKRVTCDACGLAFARGVAAPAAPGPVDASDSQTVAFEDLGLARCPNCDRPAETSATPRNHGDQLLVLKHAFDFQPPRRWDSVVFRNPATPEKAYVKRVVGLPGESVRVVDGDVFIDGEIARKPLDAIRQTRVLVHDTRYEPDDLPSRWQASDDPTGGEFRWLTYRHAIRGGGWQPASVTIPEPFREAVATIAFGTQRLGFDAATGLLTARGALAERTVATLRQVSWDPAFTDPLEQLVAASFHPPVTDRYGYNAGPSPGREHVVNDLMLEVDVAIGADAVVSLDLSDGRAAYRLTLDSVARRVTIERQGGTEPLHEASFEPREQNGRPLRIALAVIDGTATAVIDGEEPFAAIGHGVSRSPRPAAPPRVGTSGDAVVQRIMLYRDIYYTRGRGRNAVTEPHRLAADEYFVLGDNSPVSLDSRGWEQPAVPARLLIGKPFVVHLPSRPGSFTFGGSERTFRVPDFSRVRLIR